jgi:hypothetical protein
MVSKHIGHKPLALVALVLAWVVPGAGHAYVGRPVRAVIIFVTIGATFWAGVAMGGIMTVDCDNQRWWFAAEMLTGVHALVGWRRQQGLVDKLAEGLRDNRDMYAVEVQLHERQGELADELENLRTLVRRLEGNVRQATGAREKASLEERIRSARRQEVDVRNEIKSCTKQLRDLRSEFLTEALVDDGLALVAPVETVAQAYAGVAGLLNLMCIFDAVMLALAWGRPPAKPAEQKDKRP